MIVIGNEGVMDCDSLSMTYLTGDMAYIDMCRFIVPGIPLYCEVRRVEGRIGAMST